MPFVLSITEQQYKNLTVLLGIALALIARDKTSPLDWNSYGDCATTCSTPRCWMGWYSYYTGFYRGMGHKSIECQEHFGLGPRDLDKLFEEPLVSDSYLDTAKLRGAAARQLLEERAAQLSEWLEIAMIRP